MSEYLEVSFLPSEWIPKSPNFFVWWTGTLGQAEWLITHSTALRGQTVARRCPSNLSGVPETLLPLFSLEQPDLLISDSDGRPLLSIEITEQQEFGTNGQQRMARFWSAIASKVPSAYLLPIESYQIEKASEAETRILEEADSEFRQFLLNAAVLRDVNGVSLWRKGIRSLEQLLEGIEDGTLPVPSGRLASVRQFIVDHIHRSGDLARIQAVPPEEFLHNVAGTTYKIYVRPPRVTTSMLLHFMHTASSVVPTFPFKLQSEFSWMFRTNGMVHTLEDSDNPHLSYRNLLPSPGTTEVFNRRTGLDELQLFIEMVDCIVGGSPIPDLGREIFTEPDLLFPSEVRSEWRSRVDSANKLLNAGSSDMVCSSNTLRDALKKLTYSASDRLATELQDLLEQFGEFHVFKVRCNVTRSLADPYSGALAVRDLLFCRDANRSSLSDLAAFDRSAGLVFYVEMRKDGAQKHSFVETSLKRIHERKVSSSSGADPIDQLLELARTLRAEQIPKDIRCHLILSDLIIVNRFRGSTEIAEVLVGVPHLFRRGLLNRESPLMQSLTA